MPKAHDVNFEATVSGGAASASSQLWVDQGITPAQVVPTTPELAAQYLANALMHPVYEHWNWQRLIKVYGALPDARRAKPRVCKLLLNVALVVEYWQRGKLHVVAGQDAPDPTAIVAAVLKSHKTRFRFVTAGMPSKSTDTDLDDHRVPFAVALRTWLQRTGRLYNPNEHTNTLGATDDYSALSAFLRERTCRSRHTWRAYTKEFERLVTWCQAQDLGPLSDLTRLDLLKYKLHLQKMRPGGRSVGPEAPAPKASMSETSQARALAVVASLYRYWHETGYLQGNPAAGLTGGSRAQAGFAPTRLVSAELLALCDAWANRSLEELQMANVNVVRRCAIWILFRFSGARLSELAWDPSQALPRIDSDNVGAITLTVVGKGNKIRQIPLPTNCVHVLHRYRLARGLREQPDALEQIPLIHGEKAGYLGARGLYDEVKAVLLAVAGEIEQSDPQSGLLLRTVSPHWLRHAYARTLVVDKRVPLPAAQALLGHASVQTTAAYAKTDLAQLREFVEQGFGDPIEGGGKSGKPAQSAL
jgi:integrase/recombinase XerC